MSSKLLHVPLPTYGGTQARAVIKRLARPELLLLLWPLLLTLVNARWLYGGNSDYGDAWIYTGYMLNWRDHVQLFGDTYFASRVSWILPGYLAYKLLPPLVANLVLRLLITWAVLISAYGVLSLTVGRRAGMVTALLIGSYPYFLLAAGWNYVDGIGIAYFLLALWLITLASKRTREWLALGLAGVLLTALLSTTLVTALLLVPLAAYYWLINQARSSRARLLGVLPLLSGAVLGFVAFGLVNVWLGGPFLYLSAAVRFAQAAAALPSNPWIVTRPDWPLAYGYLVWPQAVAVAGLLALLVPRWHARYVPFDHARLMIGLALGTYAAFVIVQLSSTLLVMEAAYYVSYLIPTTFLALGALLAPLLARLSRSQTAALLTFIVAFGALGLAFRLCGLAPAQIVAQGLILAGIGLGLVLLLPRSWALVPLVLFVPLATPSPSRDFPGLCRPQPVEAHQAVIDGFWATRWLAPQQQVYFWYDLNETSLYRSVALTYMYDYSLLGEAFPALPEQAQSLPDASARIVLLSQQATAPQQAIAQLKQQGWNVQLAGEQRVQRDDQQFDLWLIIINR